MRKVFHPRLLSSIVLGGFLVLGVTALLTIAEPRNALLGSPRNAPPPSPLALRERAQPRAIERAQPGVIIETLDPSLEIYATMWQEEIGRRFDNAVGILVHGGNFVEGQWVVGANLVPYRRVSSAEDVVRHYQELYPGRTVVLLACNPGHLKLNIPGVYYAKANVWCVPDRHLAPSMFLSGVAFATLDSGFAPLSIADPVTRWEFAPDHIGNIYEFVSDSD